METGGWREDLEVGDCTVCHVRSHLGMLLGSRNENMPRTFKEICAVVQDTNKRDIGRCYTAIVKELDTHVGVTHVSDYMRRWGSHLGLSNREMRAGIEIADVACPRDGVCVVPSVFLISTVVACVEDLHAILDCLEPLAVAVLLEVVLCILLCSAPSFGGVVKLATNPMRFNSPSCLMPYCGPFWATHTDRCVSH